MKAGILPNICELTTTRFIARVDANKTAVVPDIVKMLSVADDSCTNATVGYITIKPGMWLVSL